MNLSRGAIHFHRLFSLRQLAIASCEPFTDRIIHKFLQVGEAVAARWVEMPQGILLLQMVPGQADSGAIYLYDRKAQVFYMIGFDGPDDNLTVEEFNQLFLEYNLVRYAEQPSLIHSPIAPAGETGPPPSMLNLQTDAPVLPAFVILKARPLSSFAIDIFHDRAKRRQCRSLYRRSRHVWFQTAGLA
jgi:hypothetical protein